LVAAAHYAISVDPQLATITATICAASGVLPDLESAARFPEKYSREKSIPGKPNCRLVRADIRRAAEEEDDSRRARRVGKDYVLSTDLFMFRPRGGWEEGTQLTANFALPANISALVPWAKISAQKYSVPHNIFQLQSLFMLGPTRPWTLKIDDLVLEVAVLGVPVKTTREGIERWLRGAGRALLQLYGETPVPKIMVLIQAVRGRGVEFGVVYRGGGPTAMFFLGRDTPDPDLSGEWVAVHELSHFVLPFVSRDQAWLSEGFASYYQNILRVRAGMLTEEEAWKNLHEGFERGRKEAGELTLREACERMHLDRRYMQVYWSGAAVALLLDVALRTQRTKPSSLDEVLRGLRSSAPETGREYSAEEIGKKLDEVAQNKLASELFAKYEGTASFPDLTATTRALGLRFVRGLVELDDRAPLAEVRKAIVAPHDAR
jgi:hypothetical protein